MYIFPVFKFEEQMDKIAIYNGNELYFEFPKQIFRTEMLR